MRFDLPLLILKRRQKKSESSFCRFWRCPMQVDPAQSCPLGQLAGDGPWQPGRVPVAGEKSFTIIQAVCDIWAIAAPGILSLGSPWTTQSWRCCLPDKRSDRRLRSQRFYWSGSKALTKHPILQLQGLNVARIFSEAIWPFYAASIEFYPCQNVLPP